MTSVALTEQRLQPCRFDRRRHRLQNAQVAGVGVDQGLRRQHHGAPRQRLQRYRVSAGQRLFDQ